MQRRSFMSLGKTVMLFGLGDLGSWVLESLIHQYGVSRIITVDKRERWGFLRTQGAAALAGNLGHYKTIMFEKCDVFDINRTAELLNKYKPDLVYSSLALVSPQMTRFLPPDIHKKIHKISGGHLIPWQLPLIIKLMRAVKESGITAPVINNSWPDIVNPMLWRHGLGPLVGAGNLANRVAFLRRIISVKENIPIPEITIYHIAEHVIGTMGPVTGIPYFLKIMIGDKDITDKYEAKSLLAETIFSGLPAGEAALIVRPTVASCAVRVIMAILNDTNELTHAPGPNGLIGGYPVRLSSKGADIILPRELTLEQAVKINEDAEKFDGIEKIKDEFHF